MEEISTILHVLFFLVYILLTEAGKTFIKVSDTGKIPDDFVDDVVSGVGSRVVCAMMCHSRLGNDCKIFSYDSDESCQLSRSSLANFDLDEGTTVVYEAYSEVVGVSEINMALKKTATQSSTYKQFYASNGVDGITTDADNKAHTDPYQSSNIHWWMVDLLFEAYVVHVDIYHRIDGFSYRMIDSEIWVGDQSDPDLYTDNTLCGTLEDDEVEDGGVTTTSCDVRGRYVMLVKTFSYKNSDSCFNFHEIDVSWKLFHGTNSFKL